MARPTLVQVQLCSDDCCPFPTWYCGLGLILLPHYRAGYIRPCELYSFDAAVKRAASGPDYDTLADQCLNRRSVRQVTPLFEDST